MINGIHRIAVLLVVLAMHFWSPTELLNALAPNEGVTLTRSIAYAAGPRHTLDVYAPDIRNASAPNGAAVPNGPADPRTLAAVVVFFYGGGFQEGSKDWYRFAGAALAESGVVVAIPDYRLPPQVQFPVFMDDAAQAVAWVRDHAKQFGGNPNRLFLMGHSAGGQIAALLALDPQYLNSVNLSPHDISGVIGLAGTYDYVPTDRAAYARIFGPPEQWPVSAPISHVTPGAPPMLLLAGRADSVVEPGNTTRLAEKLRAAGVPVTVELYSGITHAAIMAAMSTTLAFLAPARAEVLNFIAKTNATPPPHEAAPTSATPPQ